MYLFHRQTCASQSFAHYSTLFTKLPFVTVLSKDDPATFWCEGKLGFFDNYIIPLANKLKECNVFGVSSDEYLTYAMQNRKEGKERGQNIVAEMAAAIATTYQPSARR